MKTMTTDARKLQDRIRFLENEAQEEREAQERRQERERRRLAQEREERRREAEQQYRTADSWPEALRKNQSLFMREYVLDPTIDPPYTDHFFLESARACERALEIWQEVEVTRQVEIDELEARIQSIRDSIKNDVAARLDAERQTSAWRHVAEAIRSDDPTSWLNW